MKESREHHSAKEFYDLDVWKRARELRNNAFKLIRQFPLHENYGLSDQIKRASRSISACIAEGHGRFTYRDQVHFCVMARGSLMELLNHWIDAYDQKYISQEVLILQEKKIREIARMLNGYMAHLKKKQNLPAKVFRKSAGLSNTEDSTG